LTSPAESLGILVEVAYAEPQHAIVKAYRLACTAVLADALAAAAADPDFAGIDVAGAAAGVFGALARPDQPLKAGDRVEIYRTLAVDPKDARRARAKQARRKT
jgi:uncharacterized protein